MNKTARFIHSNMGKHSAFYEMLMHFVRKNPQDAIAENVPQRMASDLDYVLKKVIGDDENEGKQPKLNCVWDNDRMTVKAGPGGAVAWHLWEVCAS